jgi:glycosyltransferase involved in cell wall biosynthesis
VRTIHHSTNRGYGAALKSGIIAAKHDLIFFTDSDGQFDLKELRQLIRWSDEYQIVAGYRKKRRDPAYRLVNALAWKVLVRIVLGLKVRDIDCAFKLFHREVFNRVQIRSVGAMVNTEILVQAMRLGMRIHEVEVTHFPRQHGKPSGANVRVILKAFRELIRLRYRLHRVPQGQTGLVSTVEPL